MTYEYTVYCYAYCMRDGAAEDNLAEVTQSLDLYIVLYSGHYEIVGNLIAYVTCVDLSARNMLPGVTPHQMQYQWFPKEREWRVRTVTV